MIGGLGSSDKTQPSPNHKANGVSAMTDIQITSKWSDVKPKGFYVYLHRRATDGSVFYVGKGKGKRAWAAGGLRNNHWRNVANKNGVVVDILRDNLTDVCSFTIEKVFIGLYGRDKLCNLTDGGDGNPGAVSKRRKVVYSSLGEIFDSVSIARDFLVKNGYNKATDSNICSCCNGRYSFIYGRNWSYDGRPDHPITTSCAEVNSKRNIANLSKEIYCSNGMKFISVSRASTWLRKNGHLSASQGSISRACRTGGVAYDKMWSFNDTPIHDGTCGNLVRSIGLMKPVETSCGLFFTSLKEAGEWASMNVSPSATYHSISKCCNGHQKTAYGKRWMWYEPKNT